MSNRKVTKGEGAKLSYAKPQMTEYGQMRKLTLHDSGKGKGKGK